MGFIKKVFKNEDDKKEQPAEKAVKVEVEKKEKPTESTKLAKKIETREDDEAYKLLRKPVITEKASYLAQFNKYVFSVPMSATKAEVKKKIINVYGFKPIKINMIKMSGKMVRYGRRLGRTKNWKKAIVTLAANDKIEIYEGV